MKWIGSLAAAGLVIAAAFPAASQTSAGRAPAPRPSLMQKTPVRVSLPDTVLARVFTAGGHADITISRFRRAAMQFRVNPYRPTPMQARQILDLLVQQRTLATHVAGFPRRWNTADSVDYRTFYDRVTLTAALDSAMVEQAFVMANRGDSIPGERELGIMVRDSAVAKLSPVYDEYMLEMLATEFRALPRANSEMPPAEQLRIAALLPRVTKDDSTKTLIRTSKGSYTVGELLSDFGRLDASRRPRIESAENVRDLANSTIYENLLHEHIATQDIEHRKDVASTLADHREFLDVQAFVRIEVYGKVPTDSVALRKHWAANRRQFDAFGLADLVRMVFGTRAEAESLARRLSIPGQADTLAAISARGGIPYRTTFSEQADTVLFKRLVRAGAGAVVGPDSTIDGWRVLGVLRITPRRPRPFEECRAEVGADWVERDADRRLRALMQTLVRQTLVNTNDAALAKLAPAPRRAGGARSR